MIDPIKVNEILQELNRESGSRGTGIWTEIAGYHAINAMEVKDGKMAFIPNSAIPVKIFMNSETGELRSYWSVKFDTDFTQVSKAPHSTSEPPPIGKLGE